MSFDAWFTLLVILLCFGVMGSNRAAPDTTIFGGLTLLIIAGVISPAQAFAGFANEGVIAVGILYIVVAGLKETGAIALIAQNTLGRPKSLTGAQLRLMTPIGVVSAFLNNTPVVAMFIPAVTDWARKNGFSVSKLMMPLSYAAIIGGTCTLIGTSTNLVVNGLMKDHSSEGIGMFTLSAIGLPLVVATFAYIIITHRWLLPERVPAVQQFADARQYTVEMLVEPNSHLRGKTIEQAQLRHLPGLFLFALERDGEIIPAPGRDLRLHDNDRLIFTGVVASVVDLQKIRGLTPATDQVFKLDSPRQQRCLVEAVVSPQNPLVGKTVREGKFRNVYQAAIIAVSREGEKIDKKIGDIVLRPGDTLLLETHPDFTERQRNARDFYLVSSLEDSTPVQHDKAYLSLAILGMMILAVGSGVLALLPAVMLAAGLLIITRCVPGRTARRYIDWQVVMTIAASFGIGAAIEQSGAARALGDALIAIAGHSATLSLGIIFVATAVLTALATNNSAAVVMFPIALSTAQGLGSDILPFAITIMIAASASFATPIGYQTNLMVYGPGGYRFFDYVKFGLPLTVLTGIITVALVPVFWPFTSG